MCVLSEGKLKAHCRNSQSHGTDVKDELSLICNHLFLCNLRIVIVSGICQSPPNVGVTVGSKAVQRMSFRGSINTENKTEQAAVFRALSLLSMFGAAQRALQFSYFQITKEMRRLRYWEVKM